MMPELCSWMTETRLVKSVLHEVDKNLRAALWCDTLWSIQVSFCKLRRWRMQKWEHNIHDFLLVLSHFFSKLMYSLFIGKIQTKMIFNAWQDCLFFNFSQCTKITKNDPNWKFWLCIFTPFLLVLIGGKLHIFTPFWWVSPYVKELASLAVL